MAKSYDKNGIELMASTAQAFIKNVLPEQVCEAYSGKQGCMCGCNGRYSVNPAHKAEADSERGYEMPAARSMTQIKKVLEALQNDPRTRIIDGYILDRDALRPGERNYVVYLCKSAMI
jgi:hypothetical protein